MARGRKSFCLALFISSTPAAEALVLDGRAVVGEGNDAAVPAHNNEEMYEIPKVPTYSHIMVKAREASAKNFTRGNAGVLKDICWRVSDVLRGHSIYSGASQLLEIACQARYICERTLPDLKDGCLYLGTDHQLNVMFEAIGRPSPCAFTDIIVNSFFLREECLQHERRDGAEVKSQGGVTYESCPGGLRDDDNTCVTAVLLGNVKEHGITVYGVDSIIGLPASFEVAMARFPRRFPTNGKTPECMTRSVSAGNASPVRIEFYVCQPPSGPLADMTAVKYQLGNQITTLQEAYAGHDSCNPQIYDISSQDTEIAFANFNFDTDVHVIHDMKCDYLEIWHAEMWEQYMQPERGVAKVLLGLTSSLLGVSAFPWEECRGIFIDVRTLPGGSMVDYNLGKTLVHELGHYFGLYHTFQGGCMGQGDVVDDTNPEKHPFFSCPVPNATPPTSCGSYDMVHLYMDYSDDACMCQFTAGEGERLRHFVRRCIN